MPKEASQSTRVKSLKKDAVVATVLSMTLEKSTGAGRARMRPELAANLAEEVEDLWDNVPV